MEFISQNWLFGFLQNTFILHLWSDVWLLTRKKDAKLAHVARFDTGCHNWNSLWAKGIEEDMERIFWAESHPIKDSCCCEGLWKTLSVDSVSVMSWPQFVWVLMTCYICGVDTGLETVLPTWYRSTISTRLCCRDDLPLSKRSIQHGKQHWKLSLTSAKRRDDRWSLSLARDPGCW